MSRRSASRVYCPLQLLILLLILSSSSSSAAAACMESRNASEGRRRQARRLLVSPPSTSSLHKAEQQMQVDGVKKPFKQPTASFGRRPIPRRGFNPIQNR